MYMHSSELNDRIRKTILDLEKSPEKNESFISLLKDCMLEIEMLNGRVDVLTQECHWLNSHGNKK